MSERPGVGESQGLIGRAVDAARAWWGGQDREQKVRTVYRLWMVFLALVVIIGGWSLVRRQHAIRQNKMGREWLETANEATDITGRSAIPSSGGPAGAPAGGPSAGQPEGPVAPMGGQPGSVPPGGGQPGYAPPAKAAQPGYGQPSGGALKSGPRQPNETGRAAIPGSGG